MRTGTRGRADSQFPILNSQFGFFALWLVVIASRFPAISKSLLDWDETLFSFGVREYDVALHHPHPPGYPLFIAAAKLLRPLVSSDFRALQAVATIGSALLFPAVFLLARALKLRTSAAFAAALLTSFMPTVWYYGGTALSDVPAMSLALFACALLLRGSPRAYFAGCIAAALAAGFRPQILLIAGVAAIAGAFPLRRARVVALSWLAGAGIVALSYLGAAYFSRDFPRGYIDHVQQTTRHVREIDSLANPGRPTLRELAPKALWFPFAGGRARWLVLAFAIIAVLDAIRWTAGVPAGPLDRRRPAGWLGGVPAAEGGGSVAATSLRHRSGETPLHQPAGRRRSSGSATALLILVMFVPTAIVTWLFLDPACISRYAVAYAPALALLAAAGMSAVAAWLGRFGAPFVIVAAVVITAMLIHWTRPGLQVVHATPSPPVAAFEWVHAYVPRVGPRVFIENELEMHAAYLMADYDYKLVFEPHDIRADDLQPGNVFVVEGESKVLGAHVFKRDRERLGLLARPRYFETSVIPMQSMTWFLDGWYGEETDGASSWRWMGSKAGILFPALPGNGELRAKFYVPVDTTPRPPIVTITWNGAVVDRIRAAKPELDFRYVLPSRAGMPNEFTVSVDVWPNPKRDGTGEDTRDLGLKLLSISWEFGRR